MKGKLHPIFLTAGLPVLLLLGSNPVRAGKQTGGEFDIILRGGKIVDGTGNPWFRLTSGYGRVRITAIGSLAESRAPHIIQAADRGSSRQGLQEQPGFSGKDGSLSVDPSAG